MLTPGNSEQTVTLSYVLPFKIVADDSYSLVLQKQNGSKPFDFNGSLILAGLKAKWVSSGVVPKQNKLNFQSHSSTDDFWGFVLSK